MIKLKKKEDYDLLALKAFFCALKLKYADTHIFIEQVGAMPKQGVTSMFSMGFGLGVLTAMIVAHDFGYTRVMPKTWKVAMMEGLPRDDKRASLVAAGRLFPESLEITTGPRGGHDHNMADALLIAEWGRRRQSTPSAFEVLLGKGV